MRFYNLNIMVDCNTMHYNRWRCGRFYRCWISNFQNYLKNNILHFLLNLHIKLMFYVILNFFNNLETHISNLLDIYFWIFFSTTTNGSPLLESVASHTTTLLLHAPFSLSLKSDLKSFPVCLFSHQINMSHQGNATEVEKNSKTDEQKSESLKRPVSEVSAIPPALLCILSGFRRDFIDQHR